MAKFLKASEKVLRILIAGKVDSGRNRPLDNLNSDRNVGLRVQIEVFQPLTGYSPTARKFQPGLVEGDSHSISN